jgi:hypothetical protein
MNLSQVKPAQLREWLDELRMSPGWEVIRERLGELMLSAQDGLNTRGVVERDADWFRAQLAAYERVLGLPRTIIEESIEELQEPL